MAQEALEAWVDSVLCSASPLRRSVSGARAGVRSGPSAALRASLSDLTHPLPTAVRPFGMHDVIRSQLACPFRTIQKPETC